MSELDNTPLHKYKVGDTYMHDGVEVKIVELLDSEFRGQPMYMTQVGNNKPCMTVEGFIDHCRGIEYGVSYIASAPEELKVGDRVVVEADFEDVGKNAIGFIRGFNAEDATACVSIKQGTSQVAVIVPTKNLRKLPNSIHLYTDGFVSARSEEDSDNVKAFKAILNEMEETYRAKDADYGSAYDEGFRLFGHTQLLSRIYEKFSRVKHLLDGNKPNVAENVCDTLTDMAVQAICLRMLLQKNDFENVV